MSLSAQLGRALLSEVTYRVGTVRTRKDGDYMKVAPGKWRRLPSGGRKGKTAEPSADESLAKAHAPVPRGRKWIDHAPGLPMDTSKAHTVDGEYTPERKRLHKSIVDEFVGQGKVVPKNRKPVALFMLGITASGKSSVRKKVKNDPFEEFGTVEVDPDAVKWKLPEYRQALDASARDAAKMAHKESSDVASEIGRRAVQERRNVIFDGTGRNLEKMKRQIAEAKKAGYDVRAIMPHVPVDEALRRADARAEQTGRWVPHDVVKEMAPKVVSNFLKLAPEFGNTMLFDNSGSEPVLMFRSPPPTVVDPKRFSDFQKAKTEAIDYPISIDYIGSAMKEDSAKKEPAAKVDELERWFREMDAVARDERKGEKKYEPGEGVEMVPLD